MYGYTCMIKQTSPLARMLKFSSEEVEIGQYFSQRSSSSLSQSSLYASRILPSPLIVILAVNLTYLLGIPGFLLISRIF